MWDRDKFVKKIKLETVLKLNEQIINLFFISTSKPNLFKMDYPLD